MSAEALLAQEFGTLPELIRAHAAERPDRPALVEGDAELNYAGLAALMDRIAFALQRDGVRSGDAVAICARTSINSAAAFFGILAAGAAVAPLAPSSTPASLMMMLRDSGARVFLLDRDVAEALDGSRMRRGGEARRARRQRRRRAFLAMDRSGRIKAGRRLDRSGSSLQHHLLVRHDRRAEGHRSAASHAVGTVEPGLLQGRRDDRLDAALFEYDPRRLPSDARAWRHGGADAQIRRGRLPSPVAEAPRHPCDARSGAIPPDHGAPGLRRVRSLEHRAEVFDQRALPGGAEGGRARALARRAGRILRHDRRRRVDDARRARVSAQAAHRRAADAGP